MYCMIIRCLRATAGVCKSRTAFGDRRRAQGRAGAQARRAIRKKPRRICHAQIRILHLPSLSRALLWRHALMRGGCRCWGGACIYKRRNDLRRLFVSGPGLSRALSPPATARRVPQLDSGYMHACLTATSVSNVKVCVWVCR